MVPEIIRHVENHELRLALALCLLFHSSKGLVQKNNAGLPDPILRSLSDKSKWLNPPLSRNGTRYTVTLNLRQMMNDKVRNELESYVEQDRFAKARASWRAERELETHNHTRRINTSFAAANQATRGMSRDSYRPRSW